MLSILSHSFCCNKPVKIEGSNVEAYQRSLLQHIAIALDVIIGVGLLIAGFLTGSTIMTAVGGLQLWPVLAFVTLTLFGCKEDRMKQDIVLRFRPCCSAPKK